MDIELWITQIRAAAFTITYEVKDADQLYVRAATVVVPFDFEAQRPRRLTAEEREFLEEYRDDQHGDGAALGRRAASCGTTTGRGGGSLPSRRRIN